LLTRLLVLALLLAAVPLAWLALRAAAEFRRARRVDRLREPELSQGKPTILFFTAPYCTVCRYRQKPALEDLGGRLNGTLRILEIDASVDRAMAHRYGVWSLPTTVVVAPDGRVGAVNYGFAPAEQLRAQVESLA
jgi:thioredoxin-like negative regulator of GroEL